ncbi:retrotransposon protein, putative, ty1-copia subclass [Tanacetum coccineum]
MTNFFRIKCSKHKEEVMAVAAKTQTIDYQSRFLHLEKLTGPTIYFYDTDLMLRRSLENYKAYDMIQELKTMFEKQAKQELFKTVNAFYTCKQEEGKAIAELHAMLKLHEKGIPKKAKTPAMLAIREGKIQKNKKKLRGAKGKDKGKNKLAYSPKPKISPPPKRDNSEKDSGLRRSKKLKHRALRNCHFTPTVTRGIVSISRLVENGYSHTFTNYGISVLKDNVFYFNAISHDGIYEIDMHNLYPNVSSTFNVSNKRVKYSLDSSYLWHCRLGHINKKCIDKLQRDGILQSTHDESLKKCKSCIIGKIACKPFPHQVERAKDLLGLIHTDVCGHFRTMSKEGASYFITFIDDFNHYGYVYLMKHKHEVFETFKVFQNEVENQLGKKIKAIRSNRGGEYLSHEFVNHMKSYGIVSQLNPPYTAQHNKVSERRNRTLLDMVRSMMNLTTLPKSFWGYALESAARILNMVPTKKVERTPYEIWHGKALKLPKGNNGLLLLLSTREQDTFELPPNGRTVRSKWLFKKKTDMDGNVHTFKARLVAKGYTQTYNVDYEETFSPIADIRAIRILLAIAVFYDYEIWFDVELKKIGFTQNPDEPCVYLKASGSNVAFLILYVDEILIMENNVTMLQEVKSWLCKCFSMKDLGKAAYILGIKIIHDRSKRLIALSQCGYLDKILKKFRMENSKKGYTPIMEKPDYIKSKGAKTPSEVQRMQRVPYASAIGSIIYAVRCTRPDVAFAQNLCSRFQQNPAELKVSCYADASFQLDKDNTKSQTGYVFVLNGGAIDWKSAKQSTTAMSSTKVETMEMLYDNEPAIAIAADPGILKGARHFQRKYHYIREVIQEREIVLKKVHIDDNIADPFIKPMSFNKHYKHAMAIGIVPASSLM